MIKEFNIDVPMKLNGITLRQYQEWMKILEKYQDDKREDEEYLKVKMLQIFCGLSIEDTYKIPLQSFDDVVKHISGMFFDNRNKFHDSFLMKDDKGEVLEFGMIPNLDKMTFGEYVDLDKYINDSQSYNKAMAILFRPKIHILNNNYTIEDYEGSAKWSEYLLDMPVNVAIGAIAFMLRLQNQLLKLTQASSQAQVEKGLEVAYKQTSEENMDGFNQYTLWLKKMQLESMKQ